MAQDASFARQVQHITSEQQQISECSLASPDRRQFRKVSLASPSLPNAHAGGLLASGISELNDSSLSY